MMTPVRPRVGEPIRLVPPMVAAPVVAMPVVAAAVLVAQPVTRPAYQATTTHAQAQCFAGAPRLATVVLRSGGRPRRRAFSDVLSTPLVLVGAAPASP